MEPNVGYSPDAGRDQYPFIRIDRTATAGVWTAIPRHRALSTTTERTPKEPEMEVVLAVTLAATVMLAAALRSSRTTHPAQHRAGVDVTDIAARLAAERERTYLPARRW